VRVHVRLSNLKAASVQDIETENLAAHVSICEQRYLHLESRLDRVERGLDQIASQLLLLRGEIQGVVRSQERRWWTVLASLICCMTGALGWFLINGSRGILG